MKPATNSEVLRAKLKLKNLQAQNQLTAHHPHVANFLAAGAAAGALFFSPTAPLPLRAALPSASLAVPIDSLSDRLALVLPAQVRSLDPDQENKISQILHNSFGLHASAELEGNRLNHSYGLIGLEQHLMRFPGDSRPNTAPGRGAWGYFARSASALTPDLVAKERYYVAVQTLYLPDWSTRLPYLRDWYKHRKVVLINPKNGRAIVAVIADSGPAAWTGKQFGGSPEVMEYLQMHDGKQRGPVVLFFVDDPGDQVPLGPLEYNLEKPQ